MYSIRSYNDERFGVYGRGEFKMARETEEVIFWLITGIFIINLILFFVFLFLQYTTNPFPNAFSELIWSFISTVAVPGLLVFFFVFTFVCVMLIIMAFMGIKYTFKANDKEFVVIRKNHPEEMTVIPYSEVMTIKYKFRKFLFFERGYTVDVYMRDGTIHTFRPLFVKGDGDRSFSNTPFNIIAQEIGVVAIEKPRI